MCKIVLTRKQLEKLDKWRVQNIEGMRMNSAIAFENGVIQIVDDKAKSVLNGNGSKCGTYVEFRRVEDRVFEFKNYVITDKGERVKMIDFTFTLVEKCGAKGSASKTTAYIPMAKINTSGFIQDVVSIYFLVNYYAVANKTIKEVKHIDKATPRNERRKIGSGKYAIKPISLENVQYVGQHSKGVRDREYNFVKEVWEVRGFKRKYKDGREVWIKPSVRKRKLDRKIIESKVIVREDSVYTL